MSNEMVPYQDIEKMGQSIAASGFFGLKTKEQAIALMLVAQAQGVHPATAAMEYHVIQGKPTKKAEAKLASFINAGGSVEWHKLDDTIADATFSHPKGGTMRLTWDIDRARKAGLYDKEGSMYKKYPRQMLRSRLISEGVSMIYPAAAGGMKSPEEIDDEEFENRDKPSVDRRKSRMDNVIDADATVQHQEPEPAKEKVKESAKESDPIKEKKTAKAKPKPAAEPEPTVPTARGTIADIKIANVEKDGKPQTKFAYKIGDKFYGTFDPEINKIATRCFDMQPQVLVEVTYKERKVGEKTFQDILSFRECSVDDIPLDEIEKEQA